MGNERTKERFRFFSSKEFQKEFLTESIPYPPPKEKIHLHHWCQVPLVHHWGLSPMVHPMVQPDAGLEIIDSPAAPVL